MKKRIFKKGKNRIISSFLAAVMTMAVFAAIPATAQTGITAYNNNGYTVEYNVLNEWDGHQAVDVKIINTGTEPILNWALKYDAGGEVTGLWNGVIYENDGTEYIIKNAGYNYEVAPNTSVNFGYTLVGDNFALPDNFEIYSKRVDISEGYDVQLSETNNWGVGFQGEIVLTNTSDVPLEAWTFTFDSNFVIDNLWSGRILEAQGNTYTVASEMWTNPIMPGASVSIGFTASMDNGTIPAILNCIMSVVQIGEGNDIPIDPDPEITITAEADYDPETGLITVNWETSEPEGIFEILVSYDEENFTAAGTVTNDVTYSFEPEEFELLYIKVWQTDGERTAESGICPVVNTAEEINWEDTTDSDEDGLPDVYELHVYKTDPDNSDTDSDGLPDGYEVFILDTDPAEVDTDNNGINDGEEDFDDDGLKNSAELTGGTDPFNPDTDDDTLNDYDEIYTYNTDPLKWDTDDDKVSDGDEIILGLDPNNPETYGYPDSEYTVEQAVGEDSEGLSGINDLSDNPFTITVDINAAGVADNNLYAHESGYSKAVESPAIIGVVPELVYSGGLKTEGITINFNLDNSITGNTLGTYASDPEFAGIKRLNIFKFFEDVNMLLPVETFHDEVNNRVYAHVSELGTYCLMDMELLLDKLEIEPEDSVEPETMSVPIMPMKLSPEQKELDLVFVVYANAAYNDKIKAELIETCKNIFTTANRQGVSVRISFVAWTGDVYLNGSIYNGDDTYYTENIEETTAIINRLLPINFVFTPTDIMLTRVTNGLRSGRDIQFREDSAKFCFVIDGGCYPACTPDHFGVAYLRDDFGMDFSFIHNPGNPNIGNYSSLATDFSVHDMGLSSADITFKDFTVNHIFGEENKYPVITATGYNIVELDAPITYDYYEEYLRDPSGEPYEYEDEYADTDSDGLRDWQEILYDVEGVPYVNWDDDGNVVLYTYGEILELPRIAQFYVQSGNPDPLDRYEAHAVFEKLKNLQVLPIISDPTSDDGDGDGIKDSEEKKWDGIDERYKSVSPLHYDSVEMFFPELAVNFKKNNDNNPIWLDIQENVITIHANIYFSGDSNDYIPLAIYDPSQVVPGIPSNTLSVVTYKDIFIEGIKERWECKFDGSKVDFFETLKDIEVVVDINALTEETEKCLEINFKSGVCGNANATFSNLLSFIPGWTTSNRQIIYMYSSDCRNPNHKDKGDFISICQDYIDHIYDIEELKGVVAHEFGHALGLKDAYARAKYNDGYEPYPATTPTLNITDNEIWWDVNPNAQPSYKGHGEIMKANGEALPNDIEMILQAFSENAWQYFVHSGGNHLSKAIKSKQIGYAHYICIDKKKNQWVFEQYYYWDRDLEEWITIGDRNAFNQWIPIVF